VGNVFADLVRIEGALMGLRPEIETNERRRLALLARVKAVRNDVTIKVSTPPPVVTPKGTNP
jgi:hypothetical protein